jgi:hypothetical protein
MGAIIFGGHGEPDGDEGENMAGPMAEEAENGEPPAPDEHRHEGDMIAREAMDAIHANDHQGMHDAMTALVDHHMAKKMMKK